ncbi:MAG: S8 family serine peptidase [Novosphingobium sp.]|nr:S8 family serine peptidase [Novosphingobium sp.]
MRLPVSLVLALAVLLAAPAAAQLAVPGIALPPLGRVTDVVSDTLERTRETAARTIRDLARLRVDRLDRLVRQNRATIERDATGAPARRGELLLLDAPDSLLTPVLAAGFRMLGRERIDGLDIAVVRLAAPEGLPLGRAQALLAALLPGATVTADQLHFQAGAAASARGRAAAPAPAAFSTPVGIIDGAPGASFAVAGKRGFAEGAFTPSHHGSAMVSLLAHAGASRVWVADVYGTDPAAGNALAIARALGWLTSQGVRVISISLVGPRNPLVERAVAAARARGAIIVAAVGNDGPAAPPSYPASYPGVIAVTGVDARNRALIEAGRAAHLDYAAPGADMLAANASGKWVRVRGTSYAVPLVAARAAAALGAGGSVTAQLFATPAQAQLLGGGLGGMVGGAVGGTGTIGALPMPRDTVGSATRGTLDGGARTRGSKSVDRKSGKVRAERNADGNANGSAANATTLPGGSLLGSASGGAAASGSGSAEAQLIGTDAVRGMTASAAGTARGAAQGAVSRGHGAAGTLLGATGGVMAGAQGSGAAAGNGALSSGFGQLAAAGSIAAMAQGAFAVDKGMPVVAPDGDRVGKVREVLTDARGHVRALVVTVDGARALIPAANFSGSGSVLLSAMSEAQLEQVAERQEQADTAH